MQNSLGWNILFLKQINEWVVFLFISCYPIKKINRNILFLYMYEQKDRFWHTLSLILKYILYTEFIL